MYGIFGQLGRSGYRKHIQIDKNAPVPLYRQVVAKVRRLIDAGLLATGTRLPSPGNSQISVNRKTSNCA